MSIHPTAVIHESVQIGLDVEIGPYSVIEEGALIGDVHCVQKVALRVAEYAEGRRYMVALVWRPIVGVDGPIVLGLDEKVVVESAVLKVVYARSQDGSQHVQACELFGKPPLEQ